MTQRLCMLLALLTFAARVESAVVVQGLSSGTFANPGLSGGDPHSIGTQITWNYTGNFNDPRYVAYVSTFNSFHLFHTTNMGFGAATSNVLYGPDVPVGTPSYAGVEFYYITFTLPADAAAVTLAFTRMAADDRLQLQLNGQLIGYWGGSGGIGRMDGLGSQPTLTNVSFNANFANPPTLTNGSLFNFGGQNVLRFWVNNTGTSNVNAFSTPHSSGNPSVLDIRATLSYETSPSATVPEPCSLLGFGLLMACCFSSARRSHQKQQS